MDAVASAVPYEWGTPLPPQVGASPWDLVLLSDLVYEPDALRPLIDTIALLLEGGGGGGAGGAAGGTAAVRAEQNGNVGISSNGEAGAGGRGGTGGGGAPPTAVLVAVELRVDTGVAQFVRQLVSRGYYVERVSEANSLGARALPTTHQPPPTDDPSLDRTAAFPTGAF